MILKHSGFLFVLCIILEAISGLTPSNSNHTQDLPVHHAVTEKSQQDNGVSESVKIIASTLPPTTTSSPNNTKTSNYTQDHPNSTTTTTTTTTPAPSPSPTPAPSPSPAPAPTPDNGTWVIRDNTTKMICIIASMNMTVNITYPVKNGGLQHTVLCIPKNSSVNGSCTDAMQSMKLHWGPGHTLTINFKKNSTAKTYYVSGLSLLVNATVFKDSLVGKLNFENKSSEFMTGLDMSYKCSKAQDLNLKSDDKKYDAVLSMKDTQLEAYVNKTAVSFGAAQNCDVFDTPDIVPIAVGCALAILVLVVLVAYLIGRKRSQNRGYLSM